MDRASIPELCLEEQAPRVAGGPAAWLAVALPLGVGAWSATGVTSWAEDAAIVRDLGLLPAGSEGALSTLLTQLVTLLPIGSRSLRASLVGVFALALASRCVFELTLDLLERRARLSLNPLLALFASAVWALAPGVLAAALRVGGPLPALALVLLGVLLARRGMERADARALSATGLVLAAAVAERRAAGASLALLVLGLAVTAPSRSWHRHLARLLAGAGAGAIGLGSLRAVGLRGAPSGAPELEPLASGLELVASARLLPERWASELGAAVLVFAACGLALGALDPLWRRRLWPWVALSMSGALAPARAAAGPDPGLFGALGSLGAAVFFPLGVQAIVRWLWATPLPFGRPAAVLTVSFATTLVLTRADRAQVAHAPGEGASAWADEALLRLPPRSFLLLWDERLALRLLAARVLSGARPDVAVLPVPRLSPRSLREPELADPGLLAVLRQLWVNGDVDEYALSALADERPVFVEPGPAWERRLLEHLAPDGLWLRFAPSGVGASERRDGTAQSRGTLRRVVELAGGAAGLDPGTRSALAGAAARQAVVLDTLGERELSGRMAHAARVIRRGEGAGGAEPGEPRSHVAARGRSR